ncbi:PepSY domain-containing protein [Paracoccus caeni]|uniref:PepSY domain-containing protein n=1 Tax=Paracoccus caeni TaxID=657651 RepID=A0A934SG20_9RHOB|nr:PepSY domain-containing protein [Paracoccus caeni]MBK4216983.1 PepSY domain-containing protein [Paracoccus caeni]
MKHLSLLLLFLLIPATSGGQDTAQPDFELAQDAVARGEILPLAEVLEALARTHPGHIVEVELEYSYGIRVYEVELITEDGRLIEVDLDAATAEVLSVEDEDEDDLF